MLKQMLGGSGNVSHLVLLVDSPIKTGTDIPRVGAVFYDSIFVSSILFQSLYNFTKFCMLQRATRAGNV